MSPSINSALKPMVQQPSSVQANSNARALDGDYKAPGMGRSTTKDADGDYKATSSSPNALSSRGVQSALSTLKLGG